MPVVARSAPIAPPSTVQRMPSANELDASTIADEVAEAIKRAFAGLGA
jgi:hypothetical protein